MSLHVPEIPDGTSTLDAALLYAAAGWRVLPINQRGKHAGSVVGKDWPEKSSREPDQLAEWFDGTDHAIALHVGRSGAVVFDVDEPANVPTILADALEEAQTIPYQSTRENEPGRGHYVFAMPRGRCLGNSRGTLGSGWGDVRGWNGIIVVAPSRHQTEGARYRWEQCGELPEMTDPLVRALLETKPHASGGSSPSSRVDAILAALDFEVERIS